jgi:hypothetical protein
MDMIFYSDNKNNAKKQNSLGNAKGKMKQKTSTPYLWNANRNHSEVIALINSKQNEHIGH